MSGVGEGSTGRRIEMKVTLIEFECDAEELRSSRTLADSLNYALANVFDRIGRPVARPDEKEEEEQE